MSLDSIDYQNIIQYSDTPILFNGNCAPASMHWHIAVGTVAS